MRKIMIGVLIIALICITSGAYAVLSENATVSNDSNTNIATDNIQINSDDSEQIPVQDVSYSSVQVPQSVITTEESNFEKVVFVGTYAYYTESTAINDRYIRCIECGGFVPLGDETNPLPGAALCHHFTGRFGSDCVDYSYTHDEAYQCWMDDGQKVYDDGSCLTVRGEPMHEADMDPSLVIPNYDDLRAQADA